MVPTFSRRLWGAALVAGLTAGSILAGRGVHKPFSPNAPDFRRQGPPSAKVLLVEFSDFECPNCRAAEASLARLLALHPGQIRGVFKHFPLSQHRWARPAAIAAECAGRQGRFWEYHDLLFKRQDEWTNPNAPEFFAAYARSLNLDWMLWNACLSDPSAAAAVDRDAADARGAWVGGTPTFFINGRRFVGGRQLAELGIPFVARELRR